MPRVSRKERAKLHSKEWRESVLDGHPVVTKRYIAYTRVIDATCKLIRERVWTRRTGTVLYARPRIGKTRCALALRESLKSEFPNVLVIFLSADIAAANSSDNGLIKDILSADDVLIRGKKSRKEALAHLLIHIPMRLAALGGTQFVLIIDEMQLLRESELEQLLVLHNRLESHQISMTTIGFAQPEILNLRTALAATHAYNLIGRFLSETFVFDACRTAEDLNEILKDYDETKCYPEDTPWTFTQFFFPEAYDEGFRLANHAEAIFSALDGIKTTEGYKGIPMEHVARTIESLLLQNRNFDNSSFSLSDKHISSAVQASGLENFISLM